MASTSIPRTNMDNSYTVITQVIPSSSVPPTVQQNSFQTASPLQKFLKGEPKALGLFILVGCAPNTMLHIQNINYKNRAFTSSLISTLTCAVVTRQSAGATSSLTTVQIMTGVLTILFGIVLAVEPQTMTVYSGVTFWGSLIHISAGSLAVSASNKLNKCLVKGAMGMNIFSTLAAGIAIIFLSLDLAFGPMPTYCPGIYECYNYYITAIRTNGITGVLLVFSLLQFNISIVISAFTCQATCTNEPTLSVINVVPNPDIHVPVGNSFTHYQPQLNVSTLNAAPMNSRPVEYPPAY